MTVGVPPAAGTTRMSHAPPVTEVEVRRRNTTLAPSGE